MYCCNGVWGMVYGIAMQCDVRRHEGGGGEGIISHRMKYASGDVKIRFIIFDLIQCYASKVWITKA